MAAVVTQTTVGHNVQDKLTKSIGEVSNYNIICFQGCTVQWKGNYQEKNSIFSKKNKMAAI